MPSFSFIFVENPCTYVFIFMFRDPVVSCILNTDTSLWTVVLGASAAAAGGYNYFYAAIVPSTVLSAVSLS